MKACIRDDLGALWFSLADIKSVMLYKGKTDGGFDCAIVEVGTIHHKYNLQYVDYQHGLSVAESLKENII